MSSPFKLAAFKAYLAYTFPSADLKGDSPIHFGSIYLRFELGDDHPNGCDRRIEQATARATTLFEELFLPDEQLTLIIQNWDWSGRQFWPTTPGYLASMIRGPESDQSAEIVTWVREGEEDYSYEQILRKVDAKDLDYAAILQGKVHLEQGKHPRINESVYFISMERSLVFYMYDDRGCLIYADSVEKLRPLYQKHQAWLVEPDSPEWRKFEPDGT